MLGMMMLREDKWFKRELWTPLDRAAEWTGEDGVQKGVWIMRLFECSELRVRKTQSPSLDISVFDAMKRAKTVNPLT